VSLWFFRTFYKHATGFLGWDLAGFSKALQYVPERAVDMGAPPAPGRWQQLEIPLAKLGAEGKLLDGVGFIHPGGRIRWGRTSIVAPSGDQLDVWSDEIQPSPERLARTKISVDGLKPGTRVRVLFEDRELTAGDGYFVDDFQGRDLYQRFGGGPMAGYGEAPVALHIYEVA
jgi:hypothetical protein